MIKMISPQQHNYQEMLRRIEIIMDNDNIFTVKGVPIIFNNHMNRLGGIRIENRWEFGMDKYTVVSSWIRTLQGGADPETDLNENGDSIDTELANSNCTRASICLVYLSAILIPIIGVYLF
jgi:hypothetical protein